ncbi:hypothetical protein BDM02DRAFT_1682886 [Thelephora ganbajun]|uniref:Uncharacterized protein n=1 Tax=Thelephora ganbajun TaxID=370292 RepID=A0ACB6ZK78_THEGA|nr:hypothetical protein BDM02DRAFT_1682886 [Thelephora ganbajun]
MSFLNFAGMGFDYSTEGNTFGGYSSGNEQLLDSRTRCYHFDSEAAIAGPSRHHGASATPVCPITPPPNLSQQINREYSRHLQSGLSRSSIQLDFSLPTPSYAAKTPLPYGAYEEPLAGQSSASQWYDTLSTPSVDKGKVRATDHMSPIHPTPTENDGKPYRF